MKIWKTATLSLALFLAVAWTGAVAQAADQAVPAPDNAKSVEACGAGIDLAIAGADLAVTGGEATIEDLLADDCGEPLASHPEQPAGLESLTGLASGLAEPVAGCKPCKGRTWCKCTYNGLHRASCDPCCYTNDIGGILVCLD